MTEILFDTSAYSAMRRGHAEVASAVRRADSIAVNPVILGELQAGFRKGKHRKKNESDLRSFLASPRVRVVPIDEGTSERYAAILESLWASGTPIPTNDVWIAASAMQHGFPILTLDAHYRDVKQVMAYVFEIA